MVYGDLQRRAGGQEDQRAGGVDGVGVDGQQANGARTGGDVQPQRGDRYIRRSPQASRGRESPGGAPRKPSAPRDRRCRISQTNLSGSQSQSLWQFAAWPGTYHRPKRMPVIDHGQRPWFHAVIISDGPFYSPRIVPPPLHYTQPFRSIVFLNPAGPKGPDRCLPWVATPLFVLSLRP